MRYHIGHNIPGYMPEADIYATDNAKQAVDLLDSDLDSLQDSYAQGCPGVPENAAHVGSDHCGWCSVYYDVEADRTAFSDGYLTYKLERGGSVRLDYSPPEGADVVYWVVPCTEEDVDNCDVCSGEYGVVWSGSSYL